MNGVEAYLFRTWPYWTAVAVRYGVTQQTARALAWTSGGAQAKVLRKMAQP